ncbi:MAG: cyclic nucleotide-binding domain-containing protein [Chitinivibrionales bacterium]|nr:cyclic nucleotide-binding domain-containing protein [Chitinivibrionales bacterium]
MPERIDKQDILCHIDLFEGMSQSGRRALAGICLPKHVAKGQTLFVEGVKGLAVYILVTGSIQLYKNAPDGRRVVIKVVKPGELFAEAILFEKDTYPVTAVALKDSLLYLAPKHQFSCLLQDPSFRGDFMGSLMGKLRYLAEQIKYLSSHDVEDRLMLFLEQQYGRKQRITVTLSKRQVAEAIGATPETLSRLLLRLKREGKLQWEGKTVTVTQEAWEERTPSGPGRR